MSVKQWVCAVCKNVGLCYRSSCGSVLSVTLWVCAFDQSACQTVGLISVMLWVCAIDQSVSQVVGL